GVAELRLRPRCAGVARTSPLPLTCPARRGRLVDYGAALEMRFGATRRGFESRPLRHLRPPFGRPSRRWLPPGLTHTPQGALVRSSPAALGWTPARRAAVHRSSKSDRIILRAVDSPGRARRGTSGALYLQSAPAG